MKIRSLLTLISILFSILSPSQDLNSRILLTVDGMKTEAGEFIRMYNKNSEPGKKVSVDEYLDQFILFKLKVADAVREGIDTTKAFKTELNGYRTQLAQNYLTDTTVKEKLLKAEYQRSLYEINAWHILIGLSPDATPVDTLKAWKKAMDIRERILSGEPFEQVARSSSDDKSVLTNGGNIGYFTVFQMIMPFEDAAYTLTKDAISEPVRSAYGYHIIKVTDKRPSRGRIKVAHIMKAAPPGISEAESKKAEEEINSIYDQLQKGASFKELAKKYSDHKETAVNGGEMDWFGTGEIINDFSEAAFSLKDTGTYTKPVRTLYGWHIIKLIGKQGTKSFGESSSFLESRINQSYLNSVSKESFVNKLKKEYNFTINPEAYQWFIQNTDTLLIQGLRKYDRSTMPVGNLYSFAGQGTSTRDFATYIEKRGYMIETKDSVDFIDRTIGLRASDQLINYENSQLEKKNPEFRYLMNEFHDGILLFEISGRKIWNKINEDTAGLRQYYETSKNKYLSQPVIAGKTYTLRISNGAKALESAFRKYSSKKDPDALLLRKFNRKKDSVLVISAGKWLKGQDANIDRLKWEKGQQSLIINGYPSIIVINEILEPVPLPFEQVQGEMMNGWQEFLENSWKEQLKKTYSVKIDNVVLGEIKKKIGQR